MIEIEVPLEGHSYRIAIGAGVLGEAGRRLAAFTASPRLVVVTDTRVAALHLDTLRAGLPDILVEPVIFPPGEATKCFASLEQLCDRLLELELTRSDVVLALGGGVIGDLTGFAAAIVKRGMRFIQVPTTLLAMVDSSVGGKTGINTRRGKNLVGAFHQPVAVWSDLQLLSTLPDREMRAGYAEIVKYGLIDDADFFHWCETHAAAVLGRDIDALRVAVSTSCRAKARIVAADERETGDMRALLNLGHTFGHALEAETGFGDRLLHGEAVAIGMAQAFRFSAAQGLCAADDAARLAAHLDSLGLMSRPSQAGIAGDAAPRLIAHMLHDKKRGSHGLPFILATGIGKSFVAKSVALADVEAFLAGDLSR